MIEPPKQPRTIVSAENVAELHEEDNASHVSDQVDQADIQTNGVDHDITREPLEQQTSANSIQNGEASTSKGKKQRAKARASSNDKASVGVDMPPPRHPKSASVSESVDNRTRKVRVEPVPTTFGEGLQPEGSGSNETEETSASQVPLVPDTRVEQEADQTAIIIDNSPIGAETETPGVEAEAEVPMETDSNTPAVAETSVVAKVWTTVKRSYLDQHGPVPVPSAEQFRSFLPPGQVGDIESYQSTTSLGPSQLDPISQYPSPLRDPQTKNKGKGKGKAQQSGDSTQMAKKSKGRPRKDGGSKSAPVIVKRYINGEEVLAVESEESTESDSEYRPDPVPVPALAPAPASESAPTPATEPAPPHASEPAPASASVAASVPVTEDAMEVDTVPVSTEVGPHHNIYIVRQRADLIQNLDASQLPETVDVAPVAEAVETDAPAVQAIMQSLYESKNAEVANLQAQLAEKQKLVDELEAKVKLAETQAQAQAQAQEEAQAKAQAQAIPVPAEPIATTTDQTSAVLVETSDVSIQVDAPELVPNGVHTQAVEASSQPANSTTEASTSVVPSRNDATDTSIPTSEPSVSAEEVARLLALKDAETKKERIRAKRAERNNREMEDTLQFMRAQYEEASNSAVREVNKVKELEETVERLQGQLKFGLKQREMASEALVTQLKTESARYKRQVKVLLDQNRLTDDNVRKRAAAYHGLKSDVTRLEAALKLAKAKNQDLSDRNDELLGQVEFFRAREMGVIPPADDSDDEDYEYEYASSDSESDTSDPLSPPTKHLAQQSAVRSTDTSPSQLMPETQDLAPMVPSLPMGQTQTLAPTLAPEAITHDVEIHQDVFESPLIRDLYFVNEAVSR